MYGARERVSESSDVVVFSFLRNPPHVKHTHTHTHTHLASKEAAKRDEYREKYRSNNTRTHACEFNSTQANKQERSPRGRGRGQGKAWKRMRVGEAWKEVSAISNSEGVDRKGGKSEEDSNTEEAEKVNRINKADTSAYCGIRREKLSSKTEKGRAETKQN